MIRNAALHNTALHDDTRLHTLHKTIHKTIVHFLSSLTNKRAETACTEEVDKTRGGSRKKWMDGWSKRFGNDQWPEIGGISRTVASTVCPAD